MVAVPQWICESLYAVDDEARLAWIDCEGWPKSSAITYSRIADGREEYTEKCELGESAGHFALVKLVDTKKVGDNWFGQGQIYSHYGLAAQDWSSRKAPFRVANITEEDVYSGRVVWYLKRWNMPLKARMLDALTESEKAYDYRMSELSGAMAEEYEYTRRNSGLSSVILPDNPNQAEYQYERARAAGDVDTSDTNRYTREKQLVKETFKDEY